MKNKVLLIDLDGVLRIGKVPVPGIEKFMQFISDKSIKACVISNSTLSNSQMIKKFFENNGIELKIPLMTSVDATYQYLKDNYSSAKVYCSEELKPMFSDITANDLPEAVAVGDLGKNWDFTTINEIFKHVMNGADLVAMQKNRYWSTPEDGLLIDAGAFVTGIEYATGKKATLIGKPSPIYFKMGLKLACCKTDVPFIMLGDDIESDIKGANELGAESILIYTGKSSREQVEASEVKPKYEANDLDEAMVLLEKIL